MIYKEFGNKNKPVLILLHGGGLSWWNYKYEIENLSRDFYLILPIIDGHGEDYKTTFNSIEDVSYKIIDYIQKNFKGHIYAIGGLSIGGQIVLDILSKENNIAEFAIIESALVYPSSLINTLISPVYNLLYNLIKYRWYSFIQAKSLNIPSYLFEQYYEDTSKMSKQSLINISKSNESFSLPNSIKNTTAKVLILVGEKEISIMKKSASLINVTISYSVIEVLSGYRHGELSLCHPELYTKIITKFLIK